MLLVVVQTRPFVIKNVKGIDDRMRGTRGNNVKRNRGIWLDSLGLRSELSRNSLPNGPDSAHEVGKKDHLRQPQHTNVKKGTRLGKGIGS